MVEAGDGQNAPTENLLFLGGGGVGSELGWGLCMPTRPLSLGIQLRLFKNKISRF